MFCVSYGTYDYICVYKPSMDCEEGRLFLVCLLLERTVLGLELVCVAGFRVNVFLGGPHESVSAYS